MSKGSVYYHRGIPDTDILGQVLKVGDKVTVFNKKFISWEDCVIVEKPYQDNEEDIRKAVQIDNGKWFFGLGSHEILKEC